MFYTSLQVWAVSFLCFFCAYILPLFWGKSRGFLHFFCFLCFAQKQGFCSVYFAKYEIMVEKQKG